MGSKTSYLLPVILAVAVALLFIQPAAKPPPPTQTVEKPKAAIIDTQCLTDPNWTLVNELRGYLEEAGYQVDVYAGEEVTVDLLWRLPSLGYEVIVFRAHSLLSPEGEVALITGEKYVEEKYALKQLLGMVHPAVPLTEPNPEMAYFAVTAKFISNLNGKLDGATVILSGCQSLQNERMARAFLSKGCRAYVGWSTFVSASHADRTLRTLIIHVYVDGMAVAEAVEATMREVGPDPDYNSTLRCVLAG